MAGSHVPDFLVSTHPPRPSPKPPEKEPDPAFHYRTHNSQHVLSTYCVLCFVLIFSFLQCKAGGTDIILIIQMRKLRHKAVICLASGHTVGKLGFKAKQCGLKTSVPVSAATQTHALYLSYQVSVSTRQELPEATCSYAVNVSPLENKVDGD